MHKKFYSKEDILRAMRHTKSGRAAARYLGCSYQHYRPYAKMYLNEDGISLFDAHKNQCGKGIPKHLKGGKKQPALEQIFNGIIDPSHFTPEKIRKRLIFESYLAEECNRCKFNERRVIDYKVPLLLNFKDGNKKNYKKENLELLCYNCFFLYVTDPFTPEQVNIIEDFNQDKNNIEKPTFDMDDYLLENMKSLGIFDDEE
jgi:hypothetical protein